MPARLSLSEHTLDINVRRCDVRLFDFSEVEDYIRALTGDREYQFQAVKRILIYLWGGVYASVTELARENYRRKHAIQQRFHSEDHFLRMFPLPDRISGVCHLATGTGKSYVIFAIAHLSILLGKVSRVLVLGPASTVIEAGLREKFKEYLYEVKAAQLKPHLPERLRHKVVRLLTCNDPVEDSSIVIENINAIYNRDRNSIGDTLFTHDGEVLVLSDEVHHAYSHLEFSGETVAYDFQEGREGRGEDRNERLWLKFIREEARIRRHIGFTGTPYNQNDYFVDVIANYSIKDAGDEKLIKKIDPILKTETDEGDQELTPQQKFEQILITHAENQGKYSYPDRAGRAKVKPITTFIHPTQAAAEKNRDAFVQVLAEWLKTHDPACQGLARSQLEQTAREKVICVISRLGESEYQQKLEQIEETDPEKVGGRVEFIFAVNKLSEGWDVDNVFQIVPAEERVFNSKLLISQVLGRGLRLPRQVSVADIHGNFPVVTITNHERFGRRVQELMDEVTECEMRFTSRVISDEGQKRYAHHFNLFNLEYVPSNRVEERSAAELGGDPISRELKLTPSAEKLGVRVTYVQGVRQFRLAKDFFTVDQVVLDVERRFKNTVFESQRFDFGDGFAFDHVPGREEIEGVIRTAMARADIEGDRLSQENRQQIDLYFMQFLPKGTRKVVRENIEGAVLGIQTLELPQASARSGALDHELSVFVSEDYENELDEHNRFIMREILKEERQQTLDQPSLFSQGDFNRDYVRQMVAFKNLYAVNPSLFRTPQELVVLSHEPERQFLFRLIEDSKFITSWVKSPDSGFYGLDYEYWKGGRDRVHRSFNPDFFIRLDLAPYLRQLGDGAAAQAAGKIRELQDQGTEQLILVVEIKHDDDDSEETRAKGIYGPEHFGGLNRRLRQVNPIDLQEACRDSVNQQYAFYVLHPSEYPGWFAKLRDGRIAFDVTSGDGSGA